MTHGQADKLKQLRERAEKWLRVPARLDLKTNPPTRALSTDQELVRDLLAVLPPVEPPQELLVRIAEALGLPPEAVTLPTCDHVLVAHARATHDALVVTQQALEDAQAEQTRALLQGTVKGFQAGERHAALSPSDAGWREKVKAIADEMESVGQQLPAPVFGYMKAQTRSWAAQLTSLIHGDR